MIKYDKCLHSFSYDDNPNSSEMPSIEDIRRDKYGDVIIRMTKLLENASIRGYKFYDKIDFGIVFDNSILSRIRSSSLKDLFDRFTDVPDTLFYKKSYDEVLVTLDLLEANAQ